MQKWVLYLWTQNSKACDTHRLLLSLKDKKR